MIKVQDGEKMKSALKMACKVAQREEIFAYNCIHLKAEGGSLIIEATDGFRLYRQVIPAEGEDEFFFYRESISTIAKLIKGNIVIEGGETHATIITESFNIPIPRADVYEFGDKPVKYPRLDPLIAELEDGAYHGIINAKEFKNALETCKKVTGARYFYRVSIVADGEWLALSAKTEDGIMTMRIPCTLNLPHTLYYNSKYLLNAIPSICKEVELLYEGKKGMLLGVYGDGGKSVIARMLPDKDDLTH